MMDAWGIQEYQLRVSESSDTILEAMLGDMELWPSS